MLYYMLQYSSMTKYTSLVELCGLLLLDYSYYRSSKDHEGGDVEPKYKLAASTASLFIGCVVVDPQFEAQQAVLARQLPRAQ